jgi:hypothetical protein
MKIGIMQPYLFPYIGYFQLIGAVDIFLIYDDVNFIKQGWINRNRILMNGKPQFFTLSLRDASSFKKICDIAIVGNGDNLQKTIVQAYKKAPFFTVVYPLVQEILEQRETDLSLYVTHSIIAIARFLGLKTHFARSSERRLFPELHGESRVIAICELYQATEYVNATGGVDLYSRETFAGHRIKLQFLKTGAIEYPQLSPVFIPNLSIIDVLMFNPLSLVKEYLKRFSLV